MVDPGKSRDSRAEGVKRGCRSFSLDQAEMGMFSAGPRTVSTGQSAWLTTCYAVAIGRCVVPGRMGLRFGPPAITSTPGSSARLRIWPATPPDATSPLNDVE